MPTPAKGCILLTHFHRRAKQNKLKNCRAKRQVRTAQNGEQSREMGLPPCINMNLITAFVSSTISTWSSYRSGSASCCLALVLLPTFVLVFKPIASGNPLVWQLASIGVLFERFHADKPVSRGIPYTPSSLPVLISKKCLNYILFPQITSNQWISIRKYLSPNAVTFCQNSRLPTGTLYEVIPLQRLHIRM